MKLAKIYEPNQYEANIYAQWEQAKAFAPVAKKGSKPYSIVLPPPNANGRAHLGHALIVAAEDILIRYHRMLGKSTVYIPGTDHAGFETWVVFERQLEKEGKSRFDYSRDELYKMVWDFVAAHRGNMELQLRELGGSLDWGRLTFTLDKKVVDTSYQTFKKMWDEGLIYRGERPVNYCTKHHTGFADIEIEYEDRVTPLYYLKYGPFELATTRPETKFGDTGVAVHPDDERYKQYVGKELTIEGLNGPFKVKVVADDAVDPSFGTGAVKVTPAHDFTDWEISQRHNLPAIRVIDYDGKMTDKAGSFAGLTIQEARTAVAKALKDRGLLVRVDENYKNRVGVCYKCKTVIEPMLLDQWFVNVEPLAKRAIEALEAKQISFTPVSKRTVLIQYLKNLRDWNVSRQIAWGIPIPAFQNIKDSADWIFDTRVDQETIEIKGKTYKRDPDTFDTWFSSGQWPFITTDYLEKGELSKFYPLDVMETGSDILFSWVARMIMLGLYRTDQVPFKHVYLHGLVLDEHGKKMSKSKGNVLDPQDFVVKYGSDAMRMGIIANRSAGINQAFSPAPVIAARNFCNKLWNMARFIEDKVGESQSKGLPTPQSIADHWVLQQLDQASHNISKLIEQYRFAEAYEAVYHLVWNDIADWYIEASKIDTNKPLLGYVLEVVLKLSHPFAPFLTETIWQTLGWQTGFLMQADWPKKVLAYDKSKAEQFRELQTIVTEARYISGELADGKQTLVYSSDALIEQNASLLKQLASLQEVKKIDSPRGLHLAVAKHQAWLDVSESTLGKHRAKLESRIEDSQAQIKRLEARLATKSYVDHAPTEVVQQTKDQLAEQKALEQRLNNELTVLR
ncbi:MAG TPA: valine--tRNA ligase [Patescibacteria group bacterium]|jgi:valyl-tRNA synthetase|nr:valine--tRNA ligase [Patescibacteria group bacterium]